MMNKESISIIISLLLWTSTICLGQGVRPVPMGDVGIPGVTKPKPLQTKKPKIKYTFHDGKALLKTGLVIDGQFKFLDSDEEVPEYLFIEKGKRKKKTVALSMIADLKLKGTERGITAFTDSTEFEWIDKFKDLYRKVRNGTINLYDNSRVVDEKYNYLTDYVLLAGRLDYGHKYIRSVGDLKLLMSDRPYFMQSAKATGRLESKDFRVVIYLVDLFNDPNPLKVLKWENMTIETKNGKVLHGKGYIQPLDMRNEYVTTSVAYIHFHDGKNFKLLNHKNIKTIRINKELYKRGMYSVSNKNFFGKPWRYKNSNYLVVNKVVNGNNYFFKSKSQTGQNITILKEVTGNYLKPRNEMELKKAYLESLR